jgi:hypothetical protein
LREWRPVHIRCVLQEMRTRFAHHGSLSA